MTTRVDPMDRRIFALCLIPAGAAVLMEWEASGSAGQAAVDLLGVAAGTWACVSAASPRPEPVHRQRAVLIGLAATIAVIVAVGNWPTGYSPWATGSVWVTIIACGVVASRVSEIADILLAGALVAVAVGSTFSVGHARDGVLPLAVAVPTITALGIGLLVRSHRQRVVAERTAAVVGERAQLARELHDVIAHEVMGMVVLSQAAQAGADERMRPVLARIEESGRRALDDIRAMVANAGRTAARDTHDLRDLVDRFSETVAAQVVTVIDPAVAAPRVPDAVLLAAHRILLEAFNNVRRHAADATRVEVEVGIEGGEVCIQVCDNGSGNGGIGGGTGFGLTGLAERATAVGGTVSAGRHTDGRWRVAARLPLGENTGGTR
ncbi:sensor histidine kinase [Nocardia sp. NPDC004722]